MSWEVWVALLHKLSEQMGLKLAYRGTDNNCEPIAGANGFRLPFEAEWEHAAKGGQNHEYAGSDDIDEVAWYSDNSDWKTHPVGQKKPNGFGLYDMTGNVLEWCADDYENPGQHRPSASERARRGGGWGSNAVSCRVSVRFRDSPGARGSFLGLRLSRSLD